MQKQPLVLVSAALLLSLAACDKKAEQAGPTPSAGTGSATAVAVPEGGDWTQTVTETAEGGFVMGNPAAPVKLVEYASMTCPHCRAFSQDASTPLQENYIRSGKVSWEFRSFALNPIDVAATLLAGCQGAQPFFKLSEQVFAEQDKWVLPYQKLTAAQQNELAALPQDQQFLGLAKAGGLDNFFRVRGVPAEKAEACLTDKSRMDKILAVRERGVKEDKVEGTPTFFINGTKVDQPPTWTALEPELKKAIG